jgi:two-component system sensor kinase FixL
MTTPDPVPDEQRPPHLKHASWAVPGRAVVAAALVMGLVALERQWHLGYSLGVFYVFPVILAATVLPRGRAVLFALACVWARSWFVPDTSVIEYWLRALMALLAYGGIGLLVVEQTRNRRALVAACDGLRLEKELRQRAEEQLRILVDSSPAAIVTLNHRAEVLAANRAATELLGDSSAGALLGRGIAEQVPLFAQALAVGDSTRPLRASASSWARRADGHPFPVTTWFSTYGEGAGRCLAGILVDMSEEVRERDLEAFRQINEHHRLLAGTVSHEIRNLCSAIRVAQTNLGRHGDVAATADYAALTALVHSLSKIASVHLRETSRPSAATARLRHVLKQLLIVVEPDWIDIGGAVHWERPDGDPYVRGDASELIQVLLNLAHNSLRAVQGTESPSLTMVVDVGPQSTTVSIIDNGPGVADVTALFQPFRPDADGAGLGLYTSRAIMRSIEGDVRHMPTPTGCRFDVIVPNAPAPDAS